ncbi:MAG: T9SS type A sorting domain-containing protein [Sphingobacteriaceae bacterium]|nr:T9SS type A sorting domain-containing protein [Sphingobacteriaceae bacterium]
MDSYYNFDTIRGVTGSFEVQDSSVNYGHMNQSFDFCDLTCTVTPVKVDFNFGTVSPSITYCLNMGVDESTTAKNDVILYPNPANEAIYVKGFGQEDYELTVINSNGDLIFRDSNLSKIDMTPYSEGLYLITITSKNSKLTKKIQLIK